MKKYFSIMKINLLNNINYFSEFIFKSFFITLIIFIFINIWKTVYSNNVTIEGFTITMMIWYLLIAESIVTSAPTIVKEINKEIQSGDIAYQLNKPYNYIFYYLSKSFSYRVIGFIITFIIGSLLTLFLLGGIKISLISIPFLIITIILAMILDFFMVMSIALLAFWIEDTNSYKWIYDKIIFTIGGMLIPLEIFPFWLSNLSIKLPFSYVAYHPAKLYVNFSFFDFFNIIKIQILYVIIFMILAHLIYWFGTRRLNINGG